MDEAKIECPSCDRPVLVCVDTPCQYRADDLNWQAMCRGDKARVKPQYELPSKPLPAYREVQRQRETPVTAKTFAALAPNTKAVLRGRPERTDLAVELAGREYRYWTDGSLRRA